jgi:hypothetical protein
MIWSTGEAMLELQSDAAIGHAPSTIGRKEYCPKIQPRRLAIRQPRYGLARLGFAQYDTVRMMGSQNLVRLGFAQACFNRQTFNRSPSVFAVG